jgi:hypothetical protein
MNKNLWMVIIIVVGFLDNIDLLEEGEPLPDDILKQYEHLYQDEEDE